MDFITEPEKKIKICADVDICVIGGSCTGVFAAVRAARLGAKVAIIEKQNGFGGVATSGLVNIWHSLYDFDNKNQIIGGLTAEVIDRLKLVDGVIEHPECRNWAYSLNTAELKIELDKLIMENNIKPLLHTFYSSVISENGEVKSIIIENKDGRSAINAKFFIDATGDGDVARDLNIKSYTNNNIQPPSSLFYLEGNTDNLNDIKMNHGAEVGIEDEGGWSSQLVNSNICMHADFHSYNVLCNRADDLTFSEIDGRRKTRAYVTLLKKYGHDEKYNLITTCSYIGIRETVHYETKFKATEQGLLLGTNYEDAIMNGTYCVDIHHNYDNGVTFKELNGDMLTVYGKSKTGRSRVVGNWRKDMGLTGDYAKYYQLPLDSIVSDKYKNFTAVGRMMNADEGAFGGLRVMVNLNQLGEAAGVAAYVSLKSGLSLQKIKGSEVRKLLNTGGSLV